MQILITLYFFVLGACFGSFGLATAWRIKKKMLISGSSRSQCEHCKHKLGLADLIPIVSWLMVRGKCRYCKAKLSVLFPAAEISGGIFFSASYFFWPFSFTGFSNVLTFVLWSLGLVLLLVLFFYDIQWYTLPNKVMYPLWITAALYALVRLIDGASLASLLALVAAVGIGAGVFYIFFVVSRGSWIGFGDVRLGVAIGLFLGTPLLAALVLFVASVIGILYSLPSLVVKSRTMTSKIPFGPFLIIALILVQLFGRTLTDWYINKILLFP